MDPNPPQPNPQILGPNARPVQSPEAKALEDQTRKQRMLFEALNVTAKATLDAEEKLKKFSDIMMRTGQDMDKASQAFESANKHELALLGIKDLDARKMK